MRTPQLQASCPQEHPQPTPCCTGVSKRAREEDPPCTVPYCQQHRHQGPRLPGRRRRRLDPPPPYVRGLRAALHHRRADAADGAQALRRDRAVQPRQGDRRRPQGLQGPPGHRGPARLPRPGRRGRPAAQRPGRGRRPRGRAGDPRPRCARSTRWPTSASRASTARSSPPTTSRTRSRCCALERAAATAQPVQHGLTHRPPGTIVGKRRAGRTTSGTQRRRHSRHSMNSSTTRQHRETEHDRDGEHPRQGRRQARA